MRKARTDPRLEDDAPSDKGERIAKVMARAGLCSRRDAERWIADGRVAIDGRLLTTPAVAVQPGARVTVDGKPLPAAEPARLWRYHKPRGLVTTARDPQGRPTVFANLPQGLPRVVAVGRLDLNSEGLLLLTNDGALARKLELPANAWTRRYRVRVHGMVDPARLAALADGIAIDGVRYGPIRATLDRQQGENAWLTLSLAEGKNREVRRVCEHLGWPVSRLIRIAFGPFQLGHLQDGEVEEVTGKVLKEQLGVGQQSTPRRGAAKARPPRKQAPTSARHGPGAPRSAAAAEQRDRRRKAPRDKTGRDAHRRRPA